MFAYSGVQKINLSGRDLSHLSLFSGAGMLEGADVNIPGSQDMFAYLQNPAVIDLTGANCRQERILSRLVTSEAISQSLSSAMIQLYLI